MYLSPSEMLKLGWAYDVGESGIDGPDFPEAYGIGSAS